VSVYHYYPENAHVVSDNNKAMLFHPASVSLFHLDKVSQQVLDQLKLAGRVDSKALEQRFAPDLIERVLGDFSALNIIGPDTLLRHPAPIPDDTFALNTLILNVTTGCNLSCTYCYKEDLVEAKQGLKMSLETAQKSVDLLFAESPGDHPCNIVFFGGEPLTNLPLIKGVVDYAEARSGETGKAVTFTMTTNATMLTEAIVDYLDAHHFGLTVSIDGPQAIHDKNRITTSGRGTYNTVRRKSEMLLSRYRSRPIGARVTLTHGVTQVVEIHRHLKQELGFFEVGFAPVTAGDIASFNLTQEELHRIFAEMKILGQRYVAAALEGRNLGFGNLHQLLSNLYKGAAKRVPCAAGQSLLAVDGKGELNLCHRFTGSDMPTFGNVNTGVIDRPALNTLVQKAADQSDKGCGTCRIRGICAGGCYHESYAVTGDPLAPTYHYCDLLRDWADFGIAAYGKILDRNPQFLEQHLY
jgi:uncharacterized protein